MFFYTPYNLDAEHSVLGVISEFDVSKTVQSERDECDINVLVERFGVVPEFFPQAAVPPTYGDYTEVFDFQSSMNVVLAAQNAFMQLPAKVRARFENDPQKYLEFFDDLNNRDEAIRLGLIVPPVPEEPKGSEDTGGGKA